MNNRPANRLLVVLLTLVFAMGAIVAGCGGDSESGDGGNPTATTSQTDTTETTATGTTTETPTTTQDEPEPNGQDVATLYFATADGRLVEETRSVQGPIDVRSLLVALSGGPETPGAAPALPAGTEIVGTLVESGDAQVNLSQAFVDGYPSGGAAAEFAVLAPIVYTVTTLPGVERVRITVDGQVPAPVGSQYDWSGPFSRDDFPDAVSGG